MTPSELFHDYFERNRNRLIEKYTSFLSFQTVSAEYESRASQFDACVQWLTDWLQEIGFSVDVYREDPVAGTRKPPLIIAERKTPGETTSEEKKIPRICIYNHYDVQPVDPIDEWKTDPFEPFIDEAGTIWARGAQDNKGQCFYVLAALEALHHLAPSTPSHITLILEGEEESGSSLLTSLLPSIGPSLKSDYSMIVDMGMEESNRPAITFGARGLVALTVTVRGTTSDLHSGSHGGLAMNPLHALVQMLASLRDPASGRILVDHFYDDVSMPSEKEVSRLYQIDEETWARENGSVPTGGEKGLSMTERNWLRPTLEINGIHGGYGGEGSKTVIPREALAKITCRLVPNQPPEKIGFLVQKHLEAHTPPGVTCEVEIHEGMGSAIRSDMDSALAQSLSSVMKEVWGKEPSYVLTGGSIPVLSVLSTYLGGELLLWGVGLDSDNIHAPNEHFDMKRMKEGFLTTCLIVEKLSSTR